MNQRVFWLIALICLGVIVACSFAASLFYRGVTVPALSTQVLLQTNTNATQTAYSIAATQTFAAIPTDTPQPSPTVTPTAPPQGVTCDASVQGTSRVVYPLPGQGHSNFILERLEINAYVKIIGRLADNGWYKVEVDGRQGWMKSDWVTIKDFCQPTIYDLHYLANWLGLDEQLVFEDLFATNANAWLDAVTKNSYLIETTPQGEGQLEVNAGSEALVTVNNARLASLTAFTLYTSFTVNSVSDRSYVGVRFRENGANYYQAVLFPAGCIVSIYTNSSLYYSYHVDRRVCADRYYDMSLTFSADDHLVIQFNGFDPISINLQDPDGSHGRGGVKLVVNASDVQFDYLVILAPK